VWERFYYILLKKELCMKKILILVLALFSAQAFAVYVEAGLGVGGASTSADGESFGDYCEGCSSFAVNVGVRVGGPVMDNLFIAGELSGTGDRYFDKGGYVQFNSYIFGPSVAYYPLKQLHLSASLGFAWSRNSSSMPVRFLNGTGFGGTATVAYHIGDHNGTLLGARFAATSVTLEKSKVSLSTVSFAFFVSFVHM
jgi:hypothetical protein